jgi:signal transduction histidine kinase
MEKSGYLSADQRAQVFKRHLQGAYVRSAAIVFIWLCLLVFYFLNTIDEISMIGISLTGGAVIFFNIPFLAGLKLIRRRRAFEIYNLLINVVEILGDTVIIYFLGGVKAMYLIGIYAGLIVYVGVVAPVRYPYIVATMCAGFFGVMALLEHGGLIPHMNNQWGYPYTTTEVLLFILVLSATLYVLAFNASYTAGVLRKARKALSDQNKRLENSRKELTKTADELNLQNFRLQESMDELRKTQVQLVEREKMAALGALVAGVAHEINTPVGVGVTAASFLNDKVFDLMDVQSRRDLEKAEVEGFLRTVSEASLMIDKNLKRAAALVQNFKQVAVDQSTETARRFDVKEYVDGVLLSLHYQYKRTGHTVRVNCPKGLMMNNYPGLFSQIITNLLMNSLTHGLSDVSPGEIVMDISRDKNHLLFRYRDNGVGMPPESVQKVFEPFYTTRRGAGGTGLGMHIVYNIVTQTLGGEIKCSSSEGAGVIFDIRIPLNAPGV